MNIVNEIKTHSSLVFTVAAGKYDGFKHNTKYVESFATLDEALAAYDKVRDYPWAEIEYNGRRLEVTN